MMQAPSLPFKVVAFAAMSMGGVPSAQSLTLTDSSYGLCAHVSHRELIEAPATFEKLKEINVNNVRTDFDWAIVEPREGTWDFSKFDVLVEKANKEDIKLLPILDYDVPWAKPVWGNLDKWGEYISKTVSRYADSLRHWEVWNEPNLPGYWEGPPSAKKYTAMLKRAHEEIKKIDPALTVVYGGTSGVPLGYFEESFAEGAGNYFDVVNIHPYNWQGTPELMIDEIKGLQALLKKYNLQDKPIWITEVGWSTAKIHSFYRDIFLTAFKRAGINPAETTAAVVYDPEVGFPGAVNYKPIMDPPIFREVKNIRFSQLKDLDPQQTPVLIPTANESFPSAFIPDLLAYVKKGGTVLLPSGIPLYYDLQLNGRGGFEKVQVGDKHVASFHLAWEAWWTKEGVPEYEKWQKLAPEFAKQFEVPLTPAGRFLTADNLAPGDKFIPILEAGAGSYKGTVAALYKLNSDLKGNIIVTTSLEANQTVSEERQAEMLPRTYLIALAAGVERVYWYNFRAAEWDETHREAHFGIVHRDLTPKPAYKALGALTSLCPTGSVLDPLSFENGIYTVSWKRPDGTKCWAFWSPVKAQTVKLDIQGKVTELLSHVGEEMSFTADKNEIKISPSLVYVVGPDKVAVAKE